MQRLQHLCHETNMNAPIVLRNLQVGDIGWLEHRQGILYAQEYGWDGTFEALVAEIGAQFVKNFDSAWENAWIAECEGRVVGSVFLVKVSEQEAKLRLLYVEPVARGAGLGAVVDFVFRDAPVRRGNPVCGEGGKAQAGCAQFRGCVVRAYDGG